jgi:hypothetical protein
MRSSPFCSIATASPVPGYQYSPVGGRTRVQVIWTLSVKRIDDVRCEYTNSVVAHPTEAFMDFIAQHGMTFEQVAAARQHDGGDHNLRETPLFAKSIARRSLGRS